MRSFELFRDLFGSGSLDHKPLKPKLGVRGPGSRVGYFPKRVPNITHTYSNFEKPHYWNPSQKSVKPPFWAFGFRLLPAGRSRGSSWRSVPPTRGSTGQRPCRG